MKAYVARNSSGSITKGWLLRQGTSIGSTMCRLPQAPFEERVEEVPVDIAVQGAARPAQETARSANMPRKLGGE